METFHRKQDTIWRGNGGPRSAWLHSIKDDLLFPRGASLLVYLHYRRVCRTPLGATARPANTAAARINIWIFMKDRTQRSTVRVYIRCTCFSIARSLLMGQIGRPQTRLRFRLATMPTSRIPPLFSPRFRTMLFHLHVVFTRPTLIVPYARARSTQFSKVSAFLWILLRSIRLHGFLHWIDVRDWMFFKWNIFNDFSSTRYSNARLSVACLGPHRGNYPGK